MKIFIMAYARKNLGDDLFIKMLLEKYPQEKFYITIPKYEFADKLNNYKNLTVKIGPDSDVELKNMNEDDYDAYVYVGGSIFMEGGSVYNLSEDFYDFVKRCKQKGKPFCYISSNYGPFYTQEYVDLSKKEFETCTDICFRDVYSYELFKNVKNVRYAPDFAFTYKLPKTKIIPNTIGISVIDLDIRKNLKSISKEYIDFLVNNIENFLKEGKKVYLFSYCEYEGDKRAINKILKRVKGDNVFCVEYDGNVDEFLKIYASMEYMICGRFHSMILSVLAKQKMMVISYSEKIDNVKNDLQLNIPLLKLLDVNKNIILNENDFKAVSTMKLNKIVKASQAQIEVFDKQLNLLKKQTKKMK